MLDITSYRRKQKYVQPLTVMRQFYYDYRNHSKNKIKPLSMTDPLARRTLSVERFNKSFRELQLLTERKMNTNDQNKQNKQIKTKIQKAFSCKKDIVRNQLRKQPGYFKNFFSPTAPFLQTHSTLKAMTQPNINLSSCVQVKSINQKFADGQQSNNNIMLLRSKPNPKKVTRLYQQMVQQKQMLETQSKLKRNKYQQVKQNWIIKNLYLKPQIQQLQQVQKQAIKKSKRVAYRIKQRFQMTKENIFPSDK